MLKLDLDLLLREGLFKMLARCRGRPYTFRKLADISNNIWGVGQKRQWYIQKEKKLLVNKADETSILYPNKALFEQKV